jgi:hypothetical protein
MAADLGHIRYRVVCASGSGPYGRPTLVSAKVGKAIAPGWAASRFPHSGAAPPGRAEGPSMAHRRWLGVLPRSPAPRRLRSACAQVAIGGVCEVCVVKQEQIKIKIKSFVPAFP